MWSTLICFLLICRVYLGTQLRLPGWRDARSRSTAAFTSPKVAASAANQLIIKLQIVKNTGISIGEYRTWCYFQTKCKIGMESEHRCRWIKRTWTNELPEKLSGFIWFPRHLLAVPNRPECNLVQPGQKIWWQKNTISEFRDWSNWNHLIQTVLQFVCSFSIAASVFCIIFYIFHSYMLMLTAVQRMHISRKACFGAGAEEPKLIAFGAEARNYELGLRLQLRFLSIYQRLDEILEKKSCLLKKFS